MKSFEEIKQMIQDYEKVLNECNEMWKSEARNTPRQERLSTEVDKKFDEICSACAEHIESLIENFSKIGVELKDIGLEEHYNEPFHSFWAKVGEHGYVSKHITVKGYPYIKRGN